MARTGKTAQEFIKDSFSPLIGVLCSPKVENVVSKNNLTFTELLQPFTTMEAEGQLKEPGGNTCTIKNWKLTLRDVNWKPLQPTEARRLLNNAVLHNYNDKTVSMQFEGRKLDIPESTYWFDAWRETYLEVQFPSDHEFTKHLLSCIIVGVAHDENVIDSFNSLNQQYALLHNVTPPKLPKWFNSAVLKSYLLLHDASIISREKAEITFETLKQNFGASNCFILTINSKSASDPILTDLWAPYIKRTEANNERTSSITLPSTPAEPQTVVTTATNIDDVPGLSTSVQADTSHPLTSPDNDIYDNANSLQTHSFSGSCESVSVTSKGLDLSMEVHGSSLNMIDIDDIKKLLQDYALKTLLPYVEKQISQLSEVVSNRKGVSRSLLSATRRWFGTGKTGSATANNAVIYTSDCPELQLRRLGDLWFMCGQWQRAFDAYHTAKREFYADSAWLFYAGALEMAAISAFMAGDANRKTYGYMEESIVTYLNTCRMVQYAVRASLLSVVCLSSAGQHGEAAKQLIRMTSEDSDLRSAMLLEQASLCFLSGQPAASKAMCRKYAFHMVLAGHRFSKAGQKKHAHRCYKQAYQVYGSSGWRLATDHVQFALGRLASALRDGRAALRWLAAPLHAAPAPARHHASQQAAFLREYITAHQQWIENSEEFKDRQRLPVLPLPLVEQRATSVLCVGPAPLSAPGYQPATSISLATTATTTTTTTTDNNIWNRLEQMILQVVQGSVPMIFKPTVDLYDDATDSDPVVPKGEPIQISIVLSNPLQISLVLKEVELLWRFVSAPSEDAPEQVLNNEPAVASDTAIETNVICGHKIKSTLIEGDSKKVLTFTLTPLRVGRLSIHGLAYKLVNVGEGGNENGTGVTISGKLDLLSGVKNTDRRLQITVIPEAPCLNMVFSEMDPNIISGEMRRIEVGFANVGPVDLNEVYVAVSHPDCLLVLDDNNDDNFKQLYDDKYRVPPTDLDERSARNIAWRALAGRHVYKVDTGLGCHARMSGASRPLLLRAHIAAPTLHLLAYYETGLKDRPYRLLRHVFNLLVKEAVEVSVTPRRNLSKTDGQVHENMSLAVEIKNMNTESNELSVEVLEASLFSRQWQLNRLIATGAKDEPLLQRERLHLVFKAKRILQELSDENVNHSLLKITDKDYRKFVENAPPYSKCISDGEPTFHETNDNLLIQPPNKHNGLIDSMFVLRWKVNYKTTGRVAIGQDCLWMNCFSKALSRDIIRTPAENTTLQIDECDTKPDFTESNKKIKKDNVVLFDLEHSSQISHNFKERKICLIPITLDIVNCYGVPVKVFIDMTKQKSRECSGDVGWAGALSCWEGEGEGKEVGVRVELGRFEARRVSVSALCAAPGTYLVGAAFTARARARAASVDAPAPLLLTRLSDNTSLLVVQQA